MTGSDGMTMIKYVGGNVGTTEWYSADQKRRYVFGGARTEAWVDDRDVDYFTGLREHGQVLFVRANAKEEPAGSEPGTVEPVVSDPGAPKLVTDNGVLTITSSGAVDEKGNVLDPATGEPRPDEEKGLRIDPQQARRPDVSGMTVAEIRELEGLEVYQWEMMLADEESGKNRAGVVQFLTGKLEEVKPK